MQYNPYQKYMQQSVSTMTPAQMLIALYDKAVTELKKAMIYIDEKNYAGAHKSITRVEDIVDMLDSNLKVKYEISNNLAAIYDYLRRSLVQANVKKDKELVESLIPFFEELRDAYKEISHSGY